MADNFKNPVDFLRDHPFLQTKRAQAVRKLYRRGKGCGNGCALGPFWIEDCAECGGDGRETRYLLFVFPVDAGPCGGCDGMGRVICGEFDRTPKPEYGIRGYDAEAELQQEAKDLNSRGY